MNDGAITPAPEWRQAMDEAIDRFDIPAIHAMAIPKPMLQADPAWVEDAIRRLCTARQRTQGNANLIPVVLDTLACDDQGKIPMPLYKPMWDTGQVARMLVETGNQACMRWAKRSHLPLEYDGVMALLDQFISRMDTVDLFEPHGWLVRRQAGSTLCGSMIAVALFRGEPATVLWELVKHYQIMDPDDIAHGVGVFLRRWQAAGDTPNRADLRPQLASLAWLGRKCSPTTLREEARKAGMERDEIQALIEPLINDILAAPARLQTQAMEQHTPAAPGQRTGPRL